MLTDKKLRALLKPNQNLTPIKVADRDGLCVVVTPKGAVTFTYRFRWEKKQQNVSLGKYPLISLAEAREKVTLCRAWLAEGKDPRNQLRLARQANIEAKTVGDVLDKWLSETTRKDVGDLRKTFAKHIPKDFLRLIADDVTTDQWRAMLRAVRDGKRHKPAPVAAKFLLQNIRLAMSYDRGSDSAGVKALKEIKVEHVGKNQKEGKRVLASDELRDLLLWADDIRNPFYYRAMVKLLVTFGARTREIRLSKVGEWDLANRVWICPVDNSKNGEIIMRPIPDETLPVIQSLIDNAKQQQSELLMGVLKAHTTVSGFGARLSGTLGHDAWTFHDLRRTFASTLAERGADLTIVDILLGHKLPKIKRIYTRSQLPLQKTAVMNQWIEILQEVKNG